jgi:hypothetical protein
VFDCVFRRRGQELCDQPSQFDGSFQMRVVAGTVDGLDANLLETLGNLSTQHIRGEEGVVRGHQ